MLTLRNGISNGAAGDRGLAKGAMMRVSTCEPMSQNAARDVYEFAAIPRVQLPHHVRPPRRFKLCLIF